MTGDPARSYAAIDDADLARLSDVASEDRERFILGRPEYRERVLCVELCQGAGLHYVDVDASKQEPNGVAAIPDRPLSSLVANVITNVESRAGWCCQHSAANGITQPRRRMGRSQPIRRER